MGCLPESGGCERQRTDPFVAHLNQLENTQFIHQACLDVLDRRSPQPEALYRDCNTGLELVIERKTVVWPSDYAARHRNDHLVADILSEMLHDLAQGEPLTIHLDQLPRMRVSDLSSYANEIAEAIRTSMPSILAGRIIGSDRIVGSWRCNLDLEERMESDEPTTGLILRWPYRMDVPSIDQLPTGLVKAVRSVFDTTVIKFGKYAHARGILLLDPHGSLQHGDELWWSNMFKIAPVPLSIAEVWLGSYIWVSDSEEDWFFRRIHKI